MQALAGWESLLPLPPLLVIFTFIPFQPLVSLIFIDLAVILSAVLQSTVAQLTCEKSSDRGEDRPRLGP